ncbi:MAG TPA: hypothetical protein VFB13_14970 [Reyranella sp.]|jgi:formate hydrogenlyase subunit 3/multisubunit Na+/H+ antiporter MnhD subunit|nr:hypothetical protein [Reyranella sp.]
MRKLGGGGAIALVVLVGLLLFAIYFMLVGWDVGDSGHGGSISSLGYVAMGLGIFFTLALGIGLMALIFYSNRSGRD